MTPGAPPPPPGRRRLRPLPAAGGSVAVKICGLTRPVDAALAVDLGAAALGVVLAPSPRRVTVARAAEILAAAPAAVGRVGVFVDPDPAEVVAAVRACALDWVQLSGRETAERAEAIADAVADAVGDAVGDSAPSAQAMAPGLLKAVHVGSAADLRGLVDYPADAFLLDAPPHQGRMGGTGRTFDWSVAADLPWDRRRVVLAGGLTAANVAMAIAARRPAMVDVSSGVEAAPGIKDARRLEAFFEAVRRVGTEEIPCPR